MGTEASPTLIWFHRDQINAAVITNSSNELQFSWHRRIKSSKEEQFGAFLINQPKWGCQIGRRQGQDHKAWREDSFSILQPGQEASDRILLFWRFTLVGRASEPARHKRVLTLFGIRRLQTPLHILRDKDRSEEEGESFISSSKITEYPDLTE